MERVAEILARGIAERLHLGAQLYVSKRGEVICNEAFGEAQPGTDMGTDSIVQWYSSGKPLTAIAIAQLHEKGIVEIHEKVSRYIPEFATAGKELVTVWHLLTHTAGIRLADKIAPDLSWQETIAQICETSLEPDWMPGQKAGYSTNAAWFILAEIIQRTSGLEFNNYMRAQIFEPLEMDNTWLLLPFSEYKKYGNRISVTYDTEKGKLEPVLLQDEAGMAICRPGSSARGPIKELGRFYEMLLAGGRTTGKQLLREETIQLFTSRLRTGLFDYTFLAKFDWGLGFILNSTDYDPDKIPYGYGRHASADAFGHSGAQSSCAFADPKHNLVVAWGCNGMPGERPHQKRQREINNAIYEELRLVS